MFIRITFLKGLFHFLGYSVLIMGMFFVVMDACVQKVKEELKFDITREGMCAAIHKIEVIKVQMKEFG